LALIGQHLLERATVNQDTRDKIDGKTTRRQAMRRRRAPAWDARGGVRALPLRRQDV
jgi:hypothetical protein